MEKNETSIDIPGHDEPTSLTPADSTAPPEFTLRSSLAAAGAALSYFITVGFVNAFGVFQEYYRSTLLNNKSDFEIAWLGSFSIFCLFGFAPVAGLLADKYGPTIPISCGSIALLLAVFMTSLCKAYWQFFLAQGLLLGFGMSFIAIPASSVVPRYFKRNRGLATGFTVAGSSLGGIIWPIVFDQLLHHDSVSFAWSMRIAGFIMLPLCVVCVLVIRPPLKLQSPPEDTEKEIGSTTPGDGSKKTAKQKKDLSALRKPSFVLLCLGELVAVFGFFAPFFYISTYAVHLGFSSSLAFYLVSIINAASLFGRVLPGFVADRWGRFNMLVISAFSAGIIAFTWTKATSVAGLVVWALAYGFASGAILSMQIACATTLADEESAGAAVGTVMGATSLATLFGTPVAGELVKHGYLALSCFSGAMILAGACLIAASRLSQSRSLTARI